MTFQPKVGDPAGRSCLKADPAAAGADAVKPALGCAFDYYQNGP